MKIIKSSKSNFLVLADILILYFSLYLTLAFRYLEFPDVSIWLAHFYPFSIVFVFWLIVYFISGMYEKHTLLFKKNILNILVNAQIINATLTALFFYLIPYFGITPKVNLLLFLITSSLTMAIWRIYFVSSFGFKYKSNALIIGSGEEMEALVLEVNNNQIYNITFCSILDLDDYDTEQLKKVFERKIKENNIQNIVLNIRDQKIQPLIPYMYDLLFSSVNFLDIHKVYENIFNKVPISMLGYNWFLENITNDNKNNIYSFLKRGMDIFLGLILFLFSLFFYPFVFLAIKIDDGGKVFFRQKRVGQGGKDIEIIKFRSMPEGEHKTPTKIGRFLRKSRIDELPQLINIIKGDLSLIGPRPEVPSLVSKYKQEISYYDVRHLIKPGLSGWAQIYYQENPHFLDIDVENTKTKLSYDLFYIKNKSFVLDIKIALKTIKILLSRRGV